MEETSLFKSLYNPVSRPIVLPGGKGMKVPTLYYRFSLSATNSHSKTRGSP